MAISAQYTSRIKTKDFQSGEERGISVISRKLEPEKERIRHSTIHKQTTEHVARDQSHERESSAKKQRKRERKQKHWALNEP
jgi:hypothetical protein